DVHPIVPPKTEQASLEGNQRTARVWVHPTQHGLSAHHRAVAPTVLPRGRRPVRRPAGVTHAGTAADSSPGSLHAFARSWSGASATPSPSIASSSYRRGPASGPSARAGAPVGTARGTGRRRRLRSAVQRLPVVGFTFLPLLRSPAWPWK